MTDDAESFDDDSYRPGLAPYVKGSTTSERAARGQKPSKVRSIMVRIVDLYGSAELTMDEALRRLDPQRENYSGITPRFTLCRLLKILEPTGAVRRTSRGGLAEVLRLVPGATIAIYDAYVRGELPDVIDEAKWRRMLGKASLSYLANRSSENLSALMRVVEVGAVFVNTARAPVALEPAVAAGPNDFDALDWISDS